MLPEACPYYAAYILRLVTMVRIFIMIVLQSKYAPVCIVVHTRSMITIWERFIDAYCIVFQWYTILIVKVGLHRYYEGNKPVIACSHFHSVPPTVCPHLTDGGKECILPTLSFPIIKRILWNPTVLMINVHPQSAIKLLIIVEQFHFHQHTKAVGGYFRLLSLILKDNNTW